VQRRSFLKAAIAASATTVTAPVLAQAPGPREYYQLRKYELRSGPQLKLADQFFSEALIPALGRLGLGPTGVFKVDIGPRTPTYYVLISGTKLETVVDVNLLLGEDKEFLKVAEPFWSAPAKEPPFQALESTLMKAFEGWPKLVLPKATAQKGKRIFQLRIYESPAPADHVRKVEMFHHGEFEFFRRSGCESVFYSDALIGSGLPKLIYMLTFPDIDALNTGWDKFRADPDWKKLSADPRYSYEAIVSNIDNLVLSPLPYSQI